MLRASAAAEAAGIPSATLVCVSFQTLAKAASLGLGMPNLPTAPVPGHPGLQSKEVLQKNVRAISLGNNRLRTETAGLYCAMVLNASL